MAVKTHRVMPGETLESIALGYYGDECMGDFIFQHNAAYIQDPNHLYLGQVIVIPHVPFLKRLLD
jgi:nucleoid-associated protein YgaU